MLVPPRFFCAFGCVLAAECTLRSARCGVLAAECSLRSANVCTTRSASLVVSHPATRRQSCSHPKKSV
ncbi:hypothetical protein FHE74_10300, partial [Corynebacterium tapiri]